jgi:nitrite reductase (NADH) small subunit
MSIAAMEPTTDFPAAWDEAEWTPICALDDIVPDSGVCALIAGRQIAIVRVGEGEQVYAIDNFDPFSKAFVISRGIVGDRGGVPKIASPIFKQSFNLITGQCFDTPAVSIPVYAARVRDGQVEVRFRRAS